MKKSIIAFILSILSYVINVQAQDSIIGIVEYHFIINNPNGTSFANPYLLYFNNQASFYKGISKTPIKLKNTQKEEDQFLNDEKIVENIEISTLPSNYVYSNFVGNTLIFREKVNNKPFRVQDEIETINWELSDERKKIGKYACQKAKGFYRGRTYTIWFTSDIPVSHGPWKLRGLPGLILEASDERSLYGFRAIKIDLNPEYDSVKNSLKEPNEDKQESMEEYKIAIKNKLRDYEAMILASMPRGTKVKKNCEECPKAEDLNLEIFE